MQHNRTYSEVSDTFWPDFEQFTVRLYADLRQYFANLSSKYEVTTWRKLHFLPLLQLSLSLKDNSNNEKDKKTMSRFLAL